MNSNLPEGVFRFPLVGRGQQPDWGRAVRVSAHLTLAEAMRAANDCKRADRAHTYAVADAAALN